MSDQELRSQVNRAARIASFLDDSDVQDVLLDLTRQYVDAVMADRDDVESWYKNRVLIDMVSDLRSKVNSGIMAQQQLSAKR